MKKSTLLLFVSIFIGILDTSGAEICGLVFNKAENTPEPYATIRLFADNDSIKPVIVATSGNDGRFYLADVATGSFCLVVNAVGLKSIENNVEIIDARQKIDLGTLSLEPENELSEITVSAVKPLIKREIDRISYDVKADEDSQTQPIIEILKKVPMVSVDAEGQIKVKGSSSFKVYKNGRPNNSFTSNAKEIFKAIPASSIKRIEVITDPGAREDAEGSPAILNIVTDHETSVIGVIGSVGLSARSSNRFIPAPNIWLTAQVGKFTMSAWGGYAYFLPKGSNVQGAESTGTYQSSGNTLHTIGKSSTRYAFTYGGVETSFELDSLNLFTAEFNIAPSWNHSEATWTNEMYAADNKPIYSYNQINQTPLNHNIGIDANFNYQHSTPRKGETITLSYRLSTSRSHNSSITTYENMVDVPVDYHGVESNNRGTFWEHTGQIDWSHPINDNNVFDIGAKYINRRSHSRTMQNYIGEGLENDNFSHLTQVAAAYFDYRLNYKKFKARAGLRYEYSYLSAHYIDRSNPDFHSSLNDWVPNVSLSWSIKDGNDLKLTYGMSIRRPGIEYLNPAVTRSPYMVYGGNPDLKSARFNNLSLNYSLSSQKIYLEAAASYMFLNNSIGQYRETHDDVIYSSYINGDKYRVGSAYAYFQWSISDKSTLVTNINGGYFSIKSPLQDVGIGRWYFYTYAQFSQRLPWNLRASLSFSYNGSCNINSVYQYSKPASDAWDYYISLQRSFLKDNRLTVGLWANNLGMMHSHSTRYSVNSDYIGKTYQFYNGMANVGFSVTMRFGSLNAQVKKVNKGINNDDLQKSSGGSNSGGGSK